MTGNRDLTELCNLVRGAAIKADQANSAAQDAAESVLALVGDVKVLNTNVEALTKEVDGLSGIIRGTGDTSHSLLSRVQALEHVSGTQRELCLRHMEHLQSKEAKELEDSRRRRRINLKGQWSTVVAVIGGFFGLMSLLFTLLGKYLFKIS